MEHILIVHGLKSFCNLVQGVSAEVFRVVFVILNADVGHGSMLHELEDNEDLLVPVVQFDALDHLIALKVFSETCLVDGNLLFSRCDVLEMLHRE